MFRISFLLLFMFLSTICSSAYAQPERVLKDRLWNSLVQQIHDADFSLMSERQAVRLLLEASLICHENDKPELSGEFFQSAIEISNQDPQHAMAYDLINHAIKVEQLDIADEVARTSGRISDNLLDRLAVERYKRGDRKAIKDYPREELDMFNAINLADAYAELGEYDKLEEFVSGIVTLPTNEPKTVGAFAYEKLAIKFQKAGDIENARKFIDKAMEFGGNLYYTGYGIKVTKKSIYGELTKDLEKFAKRGAAHRSHQGRELVTNLISELARTGHFVEAKKLVPLIDLDEDRSFAMRLIAIEQAKQGAYKQAQKTTEQMSDKADAVNTLLEIAGLMWTAGESEDAKAAVGQLEKQIASEDNFQTDRIYGSLALIYGMMNSDDDIARIVKNASTPLGKTTRLVKALKGVAETSKKQK